MPTYNRAELLGLCLDRIGQLQPRGGERWYEVIVSDNASTDRTQEVLRERRGMAGLRAVRRGTNGGHVANMMHALWHAAAPLVVFVSDDDALIGEQFERYVQRMEAEPRLAALYADVSVYDDRNGREMDRYWLRPESGRFDPATASADAVGLVHFVLSHHIHPEQGIYRRDALRAAMTPWSYGRAVPWHHWMYRLRRFGAIAFETTPYYRENYVLREPLAREYHCNQQSGDAYIGDELRNVLEGVCLQAMVDSGVAGDLKLHQQFDILIREWLLGRTSVQVSRAAEAKDWIRAVELQRRL